MGYGKGALMAQNMFMTYSKEYQGIGIIPTNMPMDNFLFNPEKFREVVHERVGLRLMDDP